MTDLGMAQKPTPNVSYNELFANFSEAIQSSINRLERMLDWLLLVRENIANLNLELHSTFKSLEQLHESSQSTEDENEIACPLHPDCNKITNQVISNLNRIN